MEKAHRLPKRPFLLWKALSKLLREPIQSLRCSPYFSTAALLNSGLPRSLRLSKASRALPTSSIPISRRCFMLFAGLSLGSFVYLWYFQNIFNLRF
jgi:hypothetical protein